MGRPRKQTVTVQVEVSVTDYQLLCIEAYKQHLPTDLYVRAIVLGTLSAVKPAEPNLFAPAPPPAAQGAPLAPPAAEEPQKRKK